MAQLPSAFWCHVGEAVLHVLAGVLHGEVDDRRDAAPRRGDRVPVSNVSDATVPPNGSSMCVCTSTPPGMTYLPVASITRGGGDPERVGLPGREHGGDRLAVDEHVGRRAPGRP